MYIKKKKKTRIKKKKKEYKNKITHKKKTIKKMKEIYIGLKNLLQKLCLKTITKLLPLNFHHIFFSDLYCL